MDRSDEELAELVREGSGEVWDDLALRVLDMIRPNVLARVPEHDREDVTQDAFIRFFNALRAYSAARAPLGAFVAVITRRTVIDYYRRRGREPELEGMDSLDWVLDLAENEPFDFVAGGDLFSHVQQIAGEDAAEMIRLVVLGGFTYREVGEQFGISEAAAKMKVQRAWKRLRPTLGETYV